MGHIKLTMLTGLATVILTVAVQPVSAKSFSLENSIYADVGKATGVDPVLLYALTLNESNYQREDWDIPLGKIAPWPYTIRDPEGTMRFSSRSEAKKALKRSLARYSNVDVGISQINWRWHHNEVDSAEQLLDARFNLMLAASYLKASMARTSDRILGIGFYHNRSDLDRARNYGRRVSAIAQNLKKLMQGN